MGGAFRAPAGGLGATCGVTHSSLRATDAPPKLLTWLLTTECCRAAIWGLDRCQPVRPPACLTVGSEYKAPTADRSATPTLSASGAGLSLAPLL
eukprot:COSAG01_NODE_431_length_17124_cov_26.577386_1_plen_94_part_00